MRRQVLLDTGPLVALLSAQDSHHGWAKSEIGMVEKPFLSCEAVITEACFLLRRMHGGESAVLSLVNRGVIQIAFHLGAEAEAIAILMNRYGSVPMSLADACLVRMAELYPNSAVMTLDSDFRIYRKAGKEAIPVIMPDEGRLR
jgi:uncharacterized protein